MSRPEHEQEDERVVEAALRPRTLADFVGQEDAKEHDIYGRMLKPDSSPEQRLKAFKWAAVIIGVGATTVNPYLAEETIAACQAAVEDPAIASNAARATCAFVAAKLSPLIVARASGRQCGAPSCA